VNDRTNLHFLGLAEHLNATNAPILQMLRQLSAHFTVLAGGDAVHGHQATL